MKIDFRDIANKQKILDEYIKKSKDLEDSEEIFNKKIVALIVEMAEFANEIRFFKYWSNKSLSSEKIILDEFSDIIHFLTSIALDLNYDNWEISIDKITEKPEKLFLNTIKEIIILKETKSHNSISIIYKNLLKIANIYNFDYSKILSSYIDKNKVNFERQINNY